MKSAKKYMLSSYKFISFHETKIGPCLRCHPEIVVRLEERKNEEVAESQGKRLYRLL